METVTSGTVTMLEIRKLALMLPNFHRTMGSVAIWQIREIAIVERNRWAALPSNLLRRLLRTTFMLLSMVGKRDTIPNT